MIKVFTLGALAHNVVENHLEDHPRMLDEESSRHMLTNIRITWALSDSDSQDKGTNVENWRNIMEQVVSVLQNEKDAENVILLAPAVCAPCMVESRDVFLEQAKQEKGVGPKRLEQIRNLLKFWVPCGRKVIQQRQDNWRDTGRTTWNPGGRNDFKKPTAEKRFEFVRWVRV